MQILIVLGVAFGLLLCDLILKNYVERRMKEGEERPIGKTKFILRHVHNKGMCLNCFEKHPKLVKDSSIVATLLVLGMFLRTLIRKKQYSLKMGFALLTAGAIGNTIDRCTKGYVTDYIGRKSRHKNIENITYNLSDFFLFIGIFILWVASIFSTKRK